MKRIITIIMVAILAGLLIPGSMAITDTEVDDSGFFAISGSYGTWTEPVEYGYEDQATGKLRYKVCHDATKRQIDWYWVSDCGSEDIYTTEKSGDYQKDTTKIATKIGLPTSVLTTEQVQCTDTWRLVADTKLYHDGAWHTYGRDCTNTGFAYNTRAGYDETKIYLAQRANRPDLTSEIFPWYQVHDDGSIEAFVSLKNRGGDMAEPVIIEFEPKTDFVNFAFVSDLQACGGIGVHREVQLDAGETAVFSLRTEPLLEAKYYLYLHTIDKCHDVAPSGNTGQEPFDYHYYIGTQDIVITPPPPPQDIVITPPPPPQSCGNSVCESGETPTTCAADCGGKPDWKDWFVNNKLLIAGLIAALAVLGVGIYVYWK